MHTPFTLWMNFLHVQMICIADLHDCVNSHTNNFICLVCFCMFFDMFHILLSVDSLRDPWNVCLCIYIYIYICVFVCVCVCLYAETCTRLILVMDCILLGAFVVKILVGSKEN